MKNFLCFRNLLLSCLACCLMLIPVAANALSISYQGYAAEVNEQGVAGNPLQNAGFSVGDLFNINIDFTETASPDSAGTGFAFYNGDINSFTIAKAGYSADMVTGTVTNSINVYDSNLSSSNDRIHFDTFTVTVTTNVTGLSPYYLAVDFEGQYDVFANTNLPVVQPDPNDFDNTSAILQFIESSSGEKYPFVRIEPLVSSQENPVPEPTTMLLFGAGLVGLAGFGRKRFKK